MRPGIKPYTSAVIAVGIAVLVLLHVEERGITLPFGEPSFWLLAACVVLGEFFPIRFSGHGGEVAISTTFIFALMLTYGIGPAVAVQVLASIAADIATRKEARKLLFNVAQYVIAWSAAGAVMHAFGSIGTGRWEEPHLGGLALAALAFFAINAVLVRTAVALGEGLRLLEHLRRDLGFTAWTTGMLMALAPAVAAVQALDAVLVVFMVLPVLAVHRAASEARRNAHLATHDALTSLPNRIRFHSQVEEAIRYAGEQQLAIALMDLDRFKEINDTLGHHHGDALLCEVGRRLQAVLGDDGVVARLGGDEFALLVEADREPCVWDAVREALAKPFVIETVRLDVGASIGVSLYPRDGAEVELLMQRADVAMYRAKEERSGVRFYAREDDHHNVTRLGLASDLRTALDGGGLELHYQPTLDLVTGRVEGVEALLRWNDPARGPVSPAEFIPVAEQTGLIRPLTSFALGTALSQCRAWRDAGHPIRVAVNLSTHTLLDAGFPDEVAARLAEEGLPGSALCLEITESVLMTDPNRSMAVLERLRALGITLSVDDFGTGYSSLSYLKRLPVQEVKIDRSFVSSMSADAADRVIVRSIAELGHSLGLRVVAEGVEDELTLQQLRHLRCDIAQGFHISRPLPARDVTELFEAREPDTPSFVTTLVAATAGTGTVAAVAA